MSTTHNSRCCSNQQPHASASLAGRPQRGGLDSRGVHSSKLLLYTTHTYSTARLLPPRMYTPGVWHATLERADTASECQAGGLTRRRGDACGLSCDNTLLPS
jgi:hypothetical protein